MNTNEPVRLHDGRVFIMSPDEFPPNPRTDWDPAGTMVLFHGRYTLGDKDHGFRFQDYSGWEALERAIVRRHRPLAILPVYMMDHSGLTLSTSADRFRAGDPQGFDWGQVGFTFVTRRQMQKLGFKLEQRTVEHATEVLQTEVAVYNTYLRGDVYQYDIRAEGSDDGDACGGFYGSDLKTNGMLAHIPSEYHDELLAAEAR